MRPVVYYRCWCMDCHEEWAAYHIGKCPFCGSNFTDGKEDAVDFDMNCDESED